MSMKIILLMILLISSASGPPAVPTPRPHVLGLAPAETLVILGPTDRWDLTTGPDSLLVMTRAQAETLAAAVDTWTAYKCPTCQWRTWMVALVAVLAFGAGEL